MNIIGQKKTMKKINKIKKKVAKYTKFLQQLDRELQQQQKQTEEYNTAMIDSLFLFDNFDPLPDSQQNIFDNLFPDYNPIVYDETEHKTEQNTMYDLLENFGNITCE